MPNKFHRSPRIVLLLLATLSVASGVQAQNAEGERGGPPSRDRSVRPPTGQISNPDDAANAARKATGGKVLGVQGADRDGQPGYRVRILQPDGRVLDRHYPGNEKAD